MGKALRARFLAAGLVLASSLCLALQSSNADIPPYPNKRPPRPECGLVNRVDRVTTTRMPRAALSARGMVWAARRGSPSLQYRGIADAGTPRATAQFDWMACGYPGARGALVQIRSSADVPGNPGNEIRFVSVRAANNAITIRL